MSLWSRRASTVFHRFNFTIMDIIDLSEPEATDYKPEIFFQFYSIVLGVNQSNPGWFSSTEYLLLTSVGSYLRDDVDTQFATGGDDRLSRLQKFLVTPIVVFNNVVYEGPTKNMGRSVTFAVPSYRVFFLFEVHAHCDVVDHLSSHTRHIRCSRIYILAVVFCGFGLFIARFDPQIILLP